MVLVLCSESDRPALWAYESLRAAGLEPIDLITASALACASTWEQRLGRAGSCLSFALEDGRRFCSAEIVGVLNRLVGAPTGIVDHAVAEDREYAAAESTAFYLGWLHGLRGVINAPTPMGLCGSWRHASEWAMLAAKAGLKVPLLRQPCAGPLTDGFHPPPAGEPTRHVIVLRGELYAAAVPREVGSACRELAALAATDLLGIDLRESAEGGLVFAHAGPLPDLTLGGDALIENLARALRGGRA